MTKENSKTFFAPQLFINNGVKDISFYANAFGAIEQLHFSNDDGSLHVTELSIDGAIFHLHEVTAKPHFFLLINTTEQQPLSDCLFQM